MPRTVGLFYRIKPGGIQGFIAISQYCLLPVGRTHIKRTADIEEIDTELIDNRQIRLCQLLYHIVNLNREVGTPQIF